MIGWTTVETEPLLVQPMPSRGSSMDLSPFPVVHGPSGPARRKEGTALRQRGDEVRLGLVAALGRKREFVIATSAAQRSTLPPQRSVPAVFVSGPRGRPRRDRIAALSSGWFQLGRSTSAHSKTLRGFGATVGVHFALYNFYRVHQTLGVTPAMRAGLTTTVWSPKHLLPFAFERFQSQNGSPADIISAS